MVTKRESIGKKTTSRKATTAAPELTESSVISVLESRQTTTAVSTSIDPVFDASWWRRRRISSPSGADLRRATSSRIG
jgi:hypothetical protein